MNNEWQHLMYLNWQHLMYFLVAADTGNFTTAAEQMFMFLTAKAGLSPLDAGMYIDMFGNLVVCQIVNPYKTVRLEMPKWPLEQKGFYGFGSKAQEDCL